MKDPHKSPLAKAYMTVITMLSLGIALSDYTRMKAETSDSFLAVFHTIFILSLSVGIGYLIYLATVYYVVPKIFSVSKNRLTASNMPQERTQPTTDDRIEIDPNEGIAVMDNIISYASLTFERHLSKNQVETLCSNIHLLAQDKDVSEDIMVRLNGVTTNDLYHFGWNIGKRLKKTNTQIAWFLKDTFKLMFSDVAIDTIQTKLAIKEGTFTLKLIPLDQSLTPHTFPSF